jgi:DNA polymerase-1
LLQELLASTQFSFDTETTGLNPHLDEAVGLSFSTAPHTGWYVPLPETRAEAQAIIKEFAPALQHPEKLKIAQNLKFDWEVLAGYGVEPLPPFYDTMLAHYAIRSDAKHGMDDLARHYLHYNPISIKELIGAKGKGQLTMRQVDVAQVTNYAAEDADITLQLKLATERELEPETTGRVYHEVDLPLVPVLGTMERNGIRIDPEFLRAYSLELDKDIQLTEQQVYEAAGLKFNVASPKQLAEVLFKHLGLDAGKKTKTGQQSTDEQTLSRLAASTGHPLPALVLEYRQMAKLKSTYVDALPSLVNPRTGLIHTNYNQTVAVTGRLSSQDPNLQNIPIRTDRGREVRKAFIPRSAEYVLLSADYSQIELRIMAAFCQDPHLLEAFRSDEDVHRATAARVFNVPLEQVTSEMRRRAKMVNFGMIYGITPFGLSERLGIPRSEGKVIYDTFFRLFPTIKDYMDACVAQARAQGYVQTLMGRRQYLRDINSANATLRGFAERNAINSPIQGTAADMIKLAMIRLHHEIKSRGMKSKMLLQVHDELVLDAHLDELDVLKPLIAEAMKNALPLNGVPVEIEMGTGPNWLEAH